MCSFVRVSCSHMASCGCIQTDGTAHVSTDWMESTLLKAERAADDIAKTSAAFGTASHDVIDQLIKGETPKTIPSDVQAVVGAHSYSRWKRTNRSTCTTNLYHVCLVF